MGRRKFPACIFCQTHPAISPSWAMKNHFRFHLQMNEKRKILADYLTSLQTYELHSSRQAKCHGQLYYSHERNYLQHLPYYWSACLDGRVSCNFHCEPHQSPMFARKKEKKIKLKILIEGKLITVGSVSTRIARGTNFPVWDSQKKVWKQLSSSPIL